MNPALVFSLWVSAREGGWEVGLSSVGVWMGVGCVDVSCGCVVGNQWRYLVFSLCVAICLLK